MSRTLISHIPLHPQQYPEQGQNYVFNGCMKFLMECVGEPNEQYDYWFFSAISGDCYVQVFNTNRDQWSTCFSHAKFDRALIERVFGAIGYGFTYLEAADWRRDPQGAKERIRAYIDRGVPVLGKGFYSVSSHGVELPTSEVSCIIGYENDTFYRLTEETTELVPFTLEDALPYTFVFIGEKQTAPPVAQAYRNALKSVPGWLHTPPAGDVYFGNDAFEQWARMLETGFYRMTKAEYEGDQRHRQLAVLLHLYLHHRYQHLLQAAYHRPGTELKPRPGAPSPVARAGVSGVGCVGAGTKSRPGRF